MAFSEDFSVFFNADGFGEEFTYYPNIGSPVTLMGIFDNAYFAAAGEVAIASNQPQLVYETAKLNEKPAYGERITIKDKDYVIVGIQPDGTGTTSLALEEQNDDAC
ncbi:MAG: hypothetical protein CMM93_07115 [Rickettsiales bacterium]|nr:hypothetical protein [Rickettsiales bacterium]